MISIIGGFKKRTKLEVINKNVRPTSSYKREAIFAILESKAKKNDIEIYQKKCFLDLYAGAGAVGLEAISRGIEFSFFFEMGFGACYNNNFSSKNRTIYI